MKAISTPAAILIGSILISLAILISGKVIPLEKQAAVKGVQVEPTPATQEVKVKPVSDGDHLRGGKDARIILIEYSDLECPFCKSFHATAKAALEDYNGQLSWVFRHFPLDSLHSKARKEAESTECANELGGNDAFWKMVDKIYEVTPSNNGLDPTILPDLAVQVGLDRNKFESCLKSGKFASVVEADYQSGIEAGVNGTPGNILLDTKTGKTVVLPGAVPLGDVKQAVDSLLKP
ncbi:hypothetical protein A3J21_01940 [Candidatus Daviesbacteria bacterium RIFCSPLOWO2_02_FULL_43_11]|nr:MAG: hypothetical protein A3J21_01940 [Candidatus Daviesbacteria bacterium RIFCSPLOWO2_02_FULL_43_11]